MASFTSTGADVVERQVDKGMSWAGSFTLHEMYELSRCVTWVKQSNYRKVCLQFPDELLGDAAAVADTLKHQLNQVVYILGDTTYGSCCVDEVAAEHVGADAVIHFGNTCLSPSQRLPVLYITTKLPVDAATVVEQLKAALEEEEVTNVHPLILLCDVRCQYVAGEIFKELKLSVPHLVCSNLEDPSCGMLISPCTDKQCTCHSQNTGVEESSCNEQNPNCCKTCENCKSHSEGNSSHSKTCQISLIRDTYSNIHIESYTNENDSKVIENSENNLKKVKFNGRRVLLPEGIHMKDCNFIYLGPKGPTLECLLLRFSDRIFYHVSPSSNSVQKLSGMQSLFRRNIKLEMIRDANIIGILVGTLGVARYREAIARLKTIIKSAGKRSYTFVVGKPNEPKLANISEVDIFVYVTCPETTIIDRATDPVLYRKLATPWEVEVALVAGQDWSMTFESDFTALLPGGEHHVEVCEAPRLEEASVSLITNQTQRLGLRDASEENTAGPVVLQEGKAVAALHAGGGGQVLGGRSWAGLDPSQPTPTSNPLVVEGRKGIAAGYQDEKS